MDQVGGRSRVARVFLWKGRWASRYLVLALLVGCGHPMMAQECRRVVLTGEVKSGEEWHAEIGQGWVFRVVPIGGPLERKYSGWDMVVDRARGGGYPDALLLATPPYGSLTEREVGTTFGLRAQDAIGWNPRRFRFLLSEKDLATGRSLYAATLSAASGSEAQRYASTKLLGLLGQVGQGEFRVLDARLRMGTADPTGFARQWALRLKETPHTVEQPLGSATARGELLWVRFTTTLWFPAKWKLPAGVESAMAKCSQ